MNIMHDQYNLKVVKFKHGRAVLKEYSNGLWTIYWRPNPIGLSVLHLERIENGTLFVEGYDADVARYEFDELLVQARETEEL